MEDHAGGKNRDGEPDGRLQQKLLLMSGNVNQKVSKTFYFTFLTYHLFVIYLFIHFSLFIY